MTPTSTPSFGHRTGGVPLPVQAETIPTDLREARRWVLWRLEQRAPNGKPTKVPYIVTTPAKKASTTDPTTWRTFDDALKAYRGGQGDGVGFVLGDEFVGVDLDHCRVPEVGTLTPWAREIVSSLNSYCEVSPMAEGVKIFCKGSLPKARRTNSDGHAIEMYGASRFFTVTGHHLGDTPVSVEERTTALASIYQRFFGKNGQGSQRATGRPAAQVGLDDVALIKKARCARNGAKFSALWNGELSAYGSWSEADQALANLLAFWTGKDASRMDRLFRQSGLMRDKWNERRGERTYGDLTIERAIKDCRDTYDRSPLDRPRRQVQRESEAVRLQANPAAAREREEPEDPLILDPADPVPSARAFIDRSYLVGGRLALRHHAGLFYAHDREASAYRDCDEAALRSDLYKFLESAQRWTEARGIEPPSLVPFMPTKNKVENVLDALRALCNLPASCQAPRWLASDPGFDPFDILPCKSGLLHIPTRRLLPATPEFFCMAGVEFAFDPRAPEPRRFLQFLDELWPDDQESQETLQEWVGYLLTPRTRFQKMCLLVGPKRSGKGTIGRVIRRLLGERHVCGPTLANMSEQFGLSILIGKSAAIVSDARISGRADTAIISERLLAISGEDTLSVPRKYLPDWNGRLSTRFLLMTNELPRIEDVSGALASRFLVLTLRRSFYGCEDVGLEDRFIPELPGILNWALKGWDRLYSRGRFAQPASSTELVTQLEDLGSPISAFLRERCSVGVEHEVTSHQLFEAWRSWCQENGRDRSGTVQTFGRNLRAAVPSLTESQPRIDGARVRYYRGIGLREGAE